MSNLLIVESPAKAKTLSAMLGRGWIVRASFGHVRDLPRKELGIDRSTGAPHYVSEDRGKKTLSGLRKLVPAASHIYLATDPDREGEAIAWHLAQVLKLKSGTYNRVSYHEITETAVQKALKDPHDIDLNLVDAQQARRALDRIVGYIVSPKLWDQARGSGLKLSAGRVQTPTLRLVVERDRAIDNFKSTQHYGAEIDISHDIPFTARWDTKPYQKSPDEPYVLDKAVANLAASVKKVCIKSATDSKRFVNAPPPFTTSKLQQAASAKLDFSPEHTMRLAQDLFEKYHAITYHRTDSVHVAEEAVARIREYAKYRGYPLSDKPNKHAAKAKGAQEAHEAIRPTDPFDESPRGVTGDALDLYNLIHRQAVASQLAQCKLDTRKIRAANVGDENMEDSAYHYDAKGQVVIEPGFTVLGPAPRETRLPSLKQGQVLDVADGRVLDQQTKPPPRYTEGSLVAELERRGIGRPSTWASILKNIKDRQYIQIMKKFVHATSVGMAVIDSLCDLRFAGYNYTANMEEALDRVAAGEARYKDVVLPGWTDLESDLGKHLHPFKVPADAGAGPKRQIAPKKRGGAGKTTKHKSGNAQRGGMKCPDCGSAMVRRKSQYGEFWGCSSYPGCKTIVKI